eukprot:scaffold74832_cov56-Phaeocystis_antarctica.AAC.1
MKRAALVAMRRRDVDRRGDHHDAATRVEAFAVASDLACKEVSRLWYAEVGEPAASLLDDGLAAPPTRGTADAFPEDDAVGRCGWH